MGTLGKSLPQRSPHRFEEHLGKRYGKRVVIGRAENAKGQVWVVKCDCGRTASVHAAHLIAGRHRQCADCNRRSQEFSGHPAWRGVGGVTSVAVSHARFSAEKRGIEWSVTIEYLAEVWEAQGGKCPVSGRPLVMKRGNRKASNCSLDRIDSAKAYTPGNVRWVRKEVNFAKQAMSDADLLQLCRDIVGVADAA